MATTSAAQPAIWRAELATLLKLAAPAVVMSCSTTAMTITDQIMVGHLGRDALAAAAIGNTWYSLLFYFQMGFTTALDTKASQAHGVRDTALVVTWTAAALLAAAALCVPVAAALLAAGPVAAGAFRQPPATAAQVARFCARLVPGVLPQMLATCLLKALQAQNEMAAPAAVSVAAAVANVFLNRLMISRYGFDGAPLATSASRALLFAMALALALASRSVRLRRERRRSGAMTGGHFGKRGSRRANFEAAHTPVEFTIDDDDDDDDDDEESAHAAHDRRTAGYSMERCHRRSSAEDSAHNLALALPRVCGEAGSTTAAPVDTAALLAPCCDHNHGSIHTRAGHAASDLQWRAVARACARGARPGPLWAYSKLGLAGGAMVAFEASSFDLTTALAGLMGVVQVDAHTALLSAIAFTFMSFPFGIATAATVRVGNALGARAPAAAAAASWLAVALGAASMAACGAALLAARHALGRLFIDDDAVVALVATLAPYAAAMQVLDGVMGTSQGALRGAGWQGRLMGYNFVGFWCVGLASGCALAFGAGWGLQGLWTGITLGVGTTAALNVHSLARMDWRAEAERAAEAAAGACAHGSAAPGGGGPQPLAEQELAEM